MDKENQALASENSAYIALFEKLLSDLNELKYSEKDPILRAKLSLSISRAAAENIRRKFLDNPPTSAHDEIFFFKNIKPKFYSLKVSHCSLFSDKVGATVVKLPVA